MATAWVLGLGMVVGYLLLGGLRTGKMLLMFRPRRTSPAPPYTLRQAAPEDEAFLRQARDEGLRTSVEKTWGVWDEAVQVGFVYEWLAEVKSPCRS